MRKWLFLLFLLLVASAGFLYFRPAKTRVLHQQVQFRVNAKALIRVFPGTERWSEWWPTDNGGAVLSPAHFRYNKTDYRLVETRLNSLLFLLKRNGDSLLTALHFIPVQQDTVALTWTALEKQSAGPNAQPRWTSELADDLAALLQRAKEHYANEKNIYGVSISRTVVTDSLLVSTAKTFNAYPGPDSVYQLLDALQAYARNKNAVQTGLPMLNVTATAAGYQTRVALPVNKRLPDSGRIEFRWMLGGGGLLVTDVRGGTSAVEKAFAEMENYLGDHNLTAPAIPFQSLQTDRRKERDSTRWITGVCWPVF